MITTGIIILLVVGQFSFDMFAEEKLSNIKRKFMRSKRISEKRYTYDLAN